MIYHFKIHKEKDGYWAQCLELPGCFAQGNTVKELNKNMQEALNLYIEEPSSSSQLAELLKESIKKSNHLPVCE